MDQIEPGEDDGLPMAEVGAWSEEKYRLVAYYASLFVSSIRGRWDALVYLDLFSGSGFARIRGKNRIVLASPMVVLGLSYNFDKYIFCEENDQNAKALKERCAKAHPEGEVTVLLGDANELVDSILSNMSQPTRSHKVLGLCFLDPFYMRNLRFETIEALSKRYMDFLVLIPSGMDANRNEQNYIRNENRTLDNFLGTSEWRARWGKDRLKGESFERFVIDEFGKSMKRLGYIDPGADSAVPIRSHDKNLLLYRLALYSKHPLGNKFWREARKYTNPQKSFDF